MRTFKSVKSLRSDPWAAARFEHTSDWLLQLVDGTEMTFLCGDLEIADGIMSVTVVSKSGVIEEVHYFNMDSVRYWRPTI